MPSEFNLIARYFSRPTRNTLLAGGDDAAIVAVSPGMQLAVSSDMLVAGTHFYPDAAPADLGWKTLAVNVSDLAAMGATPRWATLALALPPERAADEAWLTAFSAGFYACAEAFAIDLIGGDTTRGPLNLCVTIFGEVSAGAALRRDGACAGDDLWVSGTPGLAALGLAHLQGRVSLADPAPCLAALHRPQPRLALGLALNGLAHAAIDISDGLLADLGHLLVASQLAATLSWAEMPCAALSLGAPAELAKECLLAGGDDYELLFTAPAAARGEIAALSAICPLSRIGSVSPGQAGDISLVDAQNRPLPICKRGFDHFDPN